MTDNQAEHSQTEHTLEDQVRAAMKPEGAYGREVLAHMNSADGAHAALSAWGLGHLDVKRDARIIDVGCGGGANLLRLLALAPESHVTGLDYSETSVATSRETAAEQIAAGRCEVVQGDVAAMPFADGSFDLVTGFETIYFWPNVPRALAEIRRVLAPDGTLFICNEDDGTSGEDWTSAIDELRVYTEDELVALLRETGFADVRPWHSVETHWLCAAATCDDRQ